jgi:predicted nucleic acid-binding protein
MAVRRRRPRAAAERGLGARGVPIELADTSAWTNRHKDPSVDEAFARALVDGRIATSAPIRIELLRTATDAVEFAMRRNALDGLRHLATGPREWQRAEDVFYELARQGPLHHRQVKLPDLLVAAAAERAEIPVLHYDGHFELIAEITGQPVRAIAPLGSL